MVSHYFKIVDEKHRVNLVFFTKRNSEAPSAGNFSPRK